MNLRKVKSDEVKIRKALLQDLQSQVKAAHVKAVGKHIGALRTPVEKPKSAMAAIEEKAEKAPEKDPEPPKVSEEAPEGDTADEEGAEGEVAAKPVAKPAKPTLSEMISRLSTGKSAK